jgi:NitT/TauT family transport system substrate-binding protein
MSARRILIGIALFWLTAITLLHGTINLNWFRNRGAIEQGKKFRVGYLPVTCHLACPVTDFINRSLVGDNIFDPVRFNGWPELKEAYLSGYTRATFILAPMAMALREQGVPIKIVYLGHRDGSGVFVHKDSGIHTIYDLRGKKIAVPNRFSNERLLIYRELNRAGMTVKDVNLLEMGPPDMPAALYSRAVDAIATGEPFLGETELDGYGKPLWLTKDVWPKFISCVLAVHESMIHEQPEIVQELVTGIARSGKWLDQKMENRMDASEFVAKQYYNQDPRLLAFVLSRPPDRVTYTELTPLRKDFEEIEKLGLQAGTLAGTAHFEDYTDVRFAEKAAYAKAYEWSGRDTKAAKPQ